MFRTLLRALCALFIAVPVAHAETIPSRSIYLVDGDTAKYRGENYRLVGYDTPETWKPKCGFEKALGEAATERARELVNDARAIDLIVLPGKDKYGRGLARILIQGQDLGDILISEGLARRYVSGKRRSWC
ncbi:thermonuclease family protein [Cognatishimia sp. D5M38]|uniref:Thermonuclease family protein n=1 Tax=Cognatishimia coralii TaxID=3083254 RepID=A0ABU8QL52_9RHOB|nr:thermonuclease family protein [Donghicola eburneus]MCI5040724.1 thermonuclease family protein [Donghicola eburneus]